jgi:hypothetical protein
MKCEKNKAYSSSEVKEGRSLVEALLRKNANNGKATRKLPAALNRAHHP